MADLQIVRTTIVLPRKLYIAVKTKALEDGQTLKHVVCQQLQHYVDPDFFCKVSAKSNSQKRGK